MEYSHRQRGHLALSSRSKPTGLCARRLPWRDIEVAVEVAKVLCCESRVAAAAAKMCVCRLSCYCHVLLSLLGWRSIVVGRAPAMGE